MIDYNNLQEDQIKANIPAHARAYVRKGWKVIQLWWLRNDGMCACPRGHNCPEKTRGKHPIDFNWTKSPIGTVDEVNESWGRRPLANIGIVTGEKSGIMVVDVDIRDNGIQIFHSYTQRFGSTMKTPTVETGSGGLHFYFRLPKVQSTDIFAEIKNRTSFIPGVDLRASGGMVVAPPSIHYSGRRYEWINGMKPGQVKILDAPKWLICLINGPKEKNNSSKSKRFKSHKGMMTGGIDKFISSLGPITDGNRNNGLCSIVGSLINFKITESQLLEAALTINADKCQPPLEESEVENMVKHAYRRWA